MGSKFRQPGEIMDYTNGGSAIAVDDVVVLSSRIGVAEVAIASGATGAVRTYGVVRLAKKNGDTPAQGALVYWDNTNKYITTTSSGNTLAGTAWNLAASGDATIDVKLQG